MTRVSLSIWASVMRNAARSPPCNPGDSRPVRPWQAAHEAANTWRPVRPVDAPAPWEEPPQPDPPRASAAAVSAAGARRRIAAQASHRAATLRRMIKSTRTSALALVAVLSILMAAFAASAWAAATVHFTPESLSAAQAQIAGGKVQAATFNKKAHTLHITLTDGRHVLASYPSHNEPQLAAALKAKGVAVTIEKTKTKKKAVHHKLRYIAGGVLVVVILIIALVLGLNRRRPQEREPGAGAPAAGTVPPAAGGGAPPGAEPPTA